MKNVSLERNDTDEHIIYSPSYVLRAMGIENDTIESSLRISWGAGTNKNEAIEGIRELLSVAKQFNS